MTHERSSWENCSSRPIEGSVDDRGVEDDDELRGGEESEGEPLAVWGDAGCHVSSVTYSELEFRFRYGTIRN